MLMSEMNLNISIHNSKKEFEDEQSIIVNTDRKHKVIEETHVLINWILAAKERTFIQSSVLVRRISCPHNKI